MNAVLARRIFQLEAAGVIFASDGVFSPPLPAPTPFPANTLPHMRSIRVIDLSGIRIAAPPPSAPAP